MVIPFLCAPLYANLISQGPIAHDMKISTHANTPYTSNLNATNAKTYKITTQPKHGTVKLTNGKFVYIPNKNFIGNDTFKYRAINGKTHSRIATVRISVTNNAPVANDMKIDTHANTLYKGNLNATDKDKDKLTYKILSKPFNGVLTLNSDGSYIYTPNKSFVGSDQFTYNVNDGISDSNTATVNINVTNTPPVAHNLTWIIPYDNWPLYNIKGQLNGTDEDNDPLTYEVVDEKKFDPVIIIDGGPRFRADLFTMDDGEYDFTYRVFDGIAYSNIATVTVRIVRHWP